MKSPKKMVPGKMFPGKKRPRGKVPRKKVPGQKKPLEKCSLLREPKNLPREVEFFLLTFYLGIFFPDTIFRGLFPTFLFNFILFKKKNKCYIFYNFVLLYFLIIFLAISKIAFIVKSVHGLSFMIDKWQPIISADGNDY